jgi:hypothetical protein
LPDKSDPNLVLQIPKTRFAPEGRTLEFVQAHSGLYLEQHLRLMHTAPQQLRGLYAQERTELLIQTLDDTLSQVLTFIVRPAPLAPHYSYAYNDELADVDRLAKRLTIYRRPRGSSFNVQSGFVDMRGITAAERHTFPLGNLRLDCGPNYLEDVERESPDFFEYLFSRQKDQIHGILRRELTLHLDEGSPGLLMPVYSTFFAAGAIPQLHITRYDFLREGVTHRVLELKGGAR